MIVVLIFFLALGCSEKESIRTGTANNNYTGMQFVENHSMENSNPDDPNRPDRWNYNNWGNNSTTFYYLNHGHSGKRSVKIEVAEYEDGDSKWFFNPIKLEPRDYVFSNFYRSNVDTRVVVAITTNTGNIEYIDWPNAPASKLWRKYEAAFSMPEHGETATVYHLLSKKGYLITDDYNIKPYQYEGLNQAMVTITFDDGWEENHRTALPIMQKYGFRSNQFYATTFIEDPWVSNPKELIQPFIDAGHEIGSHSITHQYLTKLSEEEMIEELEESKSYLEDYLDIRIEYFASPYGAYNTSVSKEIKNHYNAHRTVDSGYNSKDNFDVNRLKCMSILSTTTKSEVEDWVRKAKEENLWLILLYHRIADNPNQYDTTPELFAEHMQVINEKGIPVVTISEALAQIDIQ